ncbi:MAG TPA: dipicolinate synthase subunit DpsA [Oscillospiraceae bacterium]|nr:dipicolinate synthase subunit DpsA [Oscillospiraceae bacterium]
MDKNKIILVAGGDLRQVYLARILAETNKVYIIGFDRNVIPEGNLIFLDSLLSISERVDYIILPLPASNDGVLVNTPFFNHSLALENLNSVINENGIVFGGKFSEMVKRIFEKHKITTIDYLDREEMAVMNAVPTAEGAVQIAMEEIPTTIFGQKILITGFGRISKVLAKILNGLGADISIAVRKYSDREWAKIYGCKGILFTQLDESLKQYDIIFNTVPAIIFDKERLRMLKKGSLLIDLASKPGGVDIEEAGNAGVKTIWALSLPGKVAPISSGEIIARTILNILEERGEE